MLTLVTAGTWKVTRALQDQQEEPAELSRLQGALQAALQAATRYVFAVAVVWTPDPSLAEPDSQTFLTRKMG